MSEPIQYVFTSNGVFDSHDGVNYRVNTSTNSTFSAGLFMNSQSISITNSLGSTIITSNTVFTENFTTSGNVNQVAVSDRNGDGKFGIFYRNGDVTALWNTELGDFLQANSIGSVNFPYAISIGNSSLLGDPPYSQINMYAGNYGVRFRNDTSNFYMLQTASGNQQGIWNSFRPFQWNLTTGVVSIDASATPVGTYFGGSVFPSNNGTQNLGGTLNRWLTVYTSDLDLNNGIGDWTIVEGEDDLFLYNNKKSKVFKFNLTEVDPATAPAKKA